MKYCFTALLFSGDNTAQLKNFFRVTVNRIQIQLIPMEGGDMAEAPLYFSSQRVDAYFQYKLESGVSPGAVSKYKTAFDHLAKWLGEDTVLTAQRLQEWRRTLEDSGYSKHTVQGYVKRINDFLRHENRGDLCIPKPLRKDLRGRTFGYLTAVEPTEKRHRGKVVWRCVCRCGKEAELPSGMLLAGSTTSCGCLNMEILRYRNRYEEGTELRQSMEERVHNPNSVSGYVGVVADRGKWKAEITYKKKHYFLGRYDKLEDAVKARARAKEAVMEDAARIYRETEHLYRGKPVKPTPPVRQPAVTAAAEPVLIPARRSDNTSGYPGVTYSRGKWAVNITVKGQRYRLGAYSELEDAIAVRKQAEALVKAGDTERLKEICTNRKPRAEHTESNRNSLELRGTTPSYDNRSGGQLE